MVASVPPRQVRRARIAGLADSRDSLRKDPGDSAAGCRQRAAEDLRKADETDTANGRRVFESSAATWTARAGLLQRLENSFDARKAAREQQEGDSGEA